MADSLYQARVRHPDLFPQLVETVRAAGTDNPSHFKNGCTFEGGLTLQQNPFEFAALTLLLRELAGTPWRETTYVEIGSASGGAARFLREHAMKWETMLSLDDLGHHRAPDQDKNFSGLPIDRFRGDSHSAAAAEHVRNWCGTMFAAKSMDRLGVCFIDGDHSYDGVKMDVRLMRPYLKTGSVLIFHDTRACEGVGRAWAESFEFMEPIAEYVGDEVPLGIGVGVVR